MWEFNAKGKDMNYLEKMFSLQGKSAIISCGVRAIGLVRSEALLQAGGNVVIWSRSQESIDKACDYLNTKDGAKGKVWGAQIDAGFKKQVRNALKTADDHLGSVDLLINGVDGNIGKSSFIETDLETVQKVLHMNLVACSGSFLVFPLLILSRCHEA